MATSDRLRLDVGERSPTARLYLMARRANRFDDRALVDFVNEGAISTGEFGGYLIALFEFRTRPPLLTTAKPQKDGDQQPDAGGVWFYRS